MDMFQRQEYNAWFEYLAKLAIDRKDTEDIAELDKADISNILKAVSTIGLYVNALERENLILKKQKVLLKQELTKTQIKIL